MEIFIDDFLEVLPEGNSGRIREGAPQKIVESITKKILEVVIAESLEECIEKAFEGYGINRRKNLRDNS